MIELRGVTKRYRDEHGRAHVALDDVSLHVAEGELLCLLGRSGCGKTTTMKLVNRLVVPTSGTVEVGGVDVAKRDPIELRRSIGYVVQSGALFPHLTVAQNVGLPARLAGWAPAEIEARVDELLTLVQLDPAKIRERFVRELSGGQRQRVGVARALALRPPIMLMDEPFGALDPITREQLQRQFKQLQARLGTTIVLVTHDVREAVTLADRIAVLDGGRLVAQGTAAQLRARAEPELLRRYFGPPPPEVDDHA